MNDMRLVVVGAAGRMGQALIRAIDAVEGAVLSGAVERPGSPFRAAKLSKNAEIPAAGTTTR